MHLKVDQDGRRAVGLPLAHAEGHRAPERGRAHVRHLLDGPPQRFCQLGKAGARRQRGVTAGAPRGKERERRFARGARRSLSLPHPASPPARWLVARTSSYVQLPQLGLTWTLLTALGKTTRSTRSAHGRRGRGRLSSWRTRRGSSGPADGLARRTFHRLSVLHVHVQLDFAHANLRHGKSCPENMR